MSGDLFHRWGNVEQKPIRYLVKSIPPSTSKTCRRGRRSTSLGPLVLALSAAALLATACGSSSHPTLNTTSIAKAIQTSILRERSIQTLVTCPTGVPKKTGHRFVCFAALDVGRYPVNVLETNAKGGVSYSNSAPLRLLNVSGVEATIAKAIRRQRHQTATVKCPQKILQAAGVSFACNATSKQNRGTFTVTVVNTNGSFRYAGH